MFFFYSGMIGIPLPKVVYLFFFFFSQVVHFHFIPIPVLRGLIVFHEKYLLSSSLLLSIIFVHMFCTVLTESSTSVLMYDQFFAKLFLMIFCLQPSSKTSGQNTVIINLFLKRLMQIYVHLYSKHWALCYLQIPFIGMWIIKSGKIYITWVLSFFAGCSNSNIIPLYIIHKPSVWTQDRSLFPAVSDQQIQNSILLAAWLSGLLHMK